MTRQEGRRGLFGPSRRDRKVNPGFSRALGEIAVTFHPSGQTHTERSECGGKPLSFDSGYYEGRIAFHGEEGFTEVEASAAPGDLGFLLNIVCPGISGSSGGSFMPGAELDIGQIDRSSAHT
ncbi:MAG TPA: hypothetical protein VGN84_07905 [Solirubrobacterales bacterium]|nr:hypothetical protein [Solirubrobacterales bacterium]